MLKGVKWKINEVRRKTTAISKILFDKSKQTDDDDAAAAAAFKSKQKKKTMHAHKNYFT